MKYGIYTIHDCFLVHPAHITYLIALLNEGMSYKFHNFNIINDKEEVEIFSPFIAL